MQIGIDGRLLSGKFTGDRTYWRGLLEGLAEADTVNEYVVYLQQPIEGEPPAARANVQFRVMGETASSLLWLLHHFPRACKRDGIDVAHTQYTVPLLGMPCPVVTTVHDVSFAVHPEWFNKRDARLLNFTVPRSMHKAAAVIVPTQYTKREIARRYKNRSFDEKTHVTYEAAGREFTVYAGGKDAARAVVQSQYKLDNAPYILSVGVLQPRKNLPLLLDAFALVKLGPHKLPHKLVVTGKRGWLDKGIDDALKALPPEVQSEIVWTGYVPDDALPTLYAGADAFCYPSLYEGFGLPVLEAFACGTPVLCARAASLPEVAGDAALLLSPTNSHEWANALEKTLTQPRVLARWSERGLERAALFSWAQMARETVAVYESVARHTQKIPN